MNDQVDVEATIDRFRAWLSAARESAPAANSDGPGPEQPLPQREFGILDLVEEFTALRHELKLQTKSGRGLIDQSEATVSALRQAAEQLRAVQAKDEQTVWTAGKALAEALADLDEALARGQREIDRARHQIADESVIALEASLTALFRGRSWVRRRFLRWYHKDVIETVRQDGKARHELFESFSEGYGLIQKRLRRAMAAEQLAHVPCVGKPVNLEQMTVIDVVDEPQDQPGTVAKELRRGYTWRGRVIRYAEVQAVRGAWKSSPAPDDLDEHDAEPEPDELEMEPDNLPRNNGPGSTRAGQGIIA